MPDRFIGINAHLLQAELMLCTQRAMSMLTGISTTPPVQSYQIMMMAETTETSALHTICLREQRIIMA